MDNLEELYEQNHNISADKCDLADASDYIIEFKGHRRERFLNKKSLQLKKGDKVIVEIDSGNDIGLITHNQALRKCAENNALKHIVRLANDEDLDKDFLNKYDEEDVIFKTNDLIANYGIDMKVIDTEWQFDRQKLTIFFTAPARVDFRELVKELARQFKTRIELRQISAREETKRVGCGIGCCGQTICCTAFLFDFNQVTIEHAKLQQLSNNVTKLSGNCGRLKCCLLFEHEHYDDELKKYPLLHSTIEMEDGNALINKIDIFKKTITLFHYKQKKQVIMPIDEIAKYHKAGKIIQPKDEAIKKISTDEDIMIEDF